MLGNKYYALKGKISDDLFDVFHVSTRYGKISFFIYGYLTFLRAKTLLTKERETIEWIDNMEQNSIMWDVGANVGCYSLYAAKKGVNVFSFEPSFMNFYVLNKNIVINDLSDKISSFYIPFSDETKMNTFYSCDNIMGSAYNSINSTNVNIKNNIENNIAKSNDIGFNTKAISYKIDDFITQFELEKPNYIKIDVDGVEQLIIKGAIDTLKSTCVKSILIELNHGLNDHIVIGNILKDLGYKIKYFNEKCLETYNITNYIFEKE